MAAEEEHTPLGERMEQIGSAWRTVKRSVSDSSKNAQTLEQVKKMQAAAKGSMDFKPDMLKDIPDAEKEKFLADYNKQMKSFAARLDKLARMLEAGDNAAASVLVKQIDEHRSESHEAFKRPE